MKTKTDINSILGQNAFWQINKKLAKYIGIEASLLISDLVGKSSYFDNNGQLTDDGFFFNTRENIEEDTTLTPHKQRKAITILVKAGFLETKEFGIPKKTHYKVVNDKLLNFLTTGSQKIQPLEVKKFNTNKNKENIINNKNKVTDATKVAHKTKPKSDYLKSAYTVASKLELPIRNHGTFRSKIKELHNMLGDEKYNNYIEYLASYSHENIKWDGDRLRVAEDIALKYGAMKANYSKSKPIKVIGKALV